MSDDTKLPRLQALCDDLLEVFLVEADPTRWTGAGVDPTEMDPKIRGARNWDMKNANQAGALAARALDLRDRLAGGDGGKPPGTQQIDDAAEHDIARFEKQARDALAKIRAG